jgi:hypothetical protein
VTLHPKERISIHHTFELVVDGTAPSGLTNTDGQLLDGADKGEPDSDYRAQLTWRNLVISPQVLRKYVPAKRTSVDVKTRSDAHAASSLPGRFAKSHASRR